MSSKKTFEETMTSVSEELEQGRELILGDKIDDFQSAVRNVKAKMADILEENRVMRLGIVGAVKAGKSSFLNALLFDGKDVLPKAPTPMTAALTKISYSSQPSVRVVFYDRDDWERGIEQYAQRYKDSIRERYEAYRKENDRQRVEWEKSQKRLSFRPERPAPAKPPALMTPEQYEKACKDSLPEEVVACHEVYEMAHEQMNSTEIQAVLSQNEITLTGEQMQRDMKQYVGAKGKYTPLVKYTVIQLDNEMLKGIEVIDTPGLNDPILSRSRVTQQFLTACDAVFLLSYCGQFLSAEDIGFLMGTLPAEGISYAVLAGTKMDSAILQYPNQKASFKRAYQGTMKNCIDQAKENLEKCIQTAGSTPLLEQIADSQLFCTSAMAYAAALKKEAGETLNDDERKVLENLKSRYPDFQDNPETLRGLSSIPDIKGGVFQSVWEKKEEIKEKKIHDFEKSQRGKFTRLLEEIASQARTNRKDLKESDLEQLNAKLRSAKEGLDAARVTVTGVFQGAANDAMQAAADLKVEVRKEVGNHFRIDVATDTQNIEHSKTSGWWLWKKTRHWTERITTHSANVVDANHNIDGFYTDVLDIVNSRMRHLFKMEDVRERVSKSVMQAFDRSDRNFNEDAILIPLKNALGRISIPSIDIDIEKYHRTLDQKLTGIATSGVVKNESIPMLKQAQDEVLRAMTADLCATIDAQGKKMSGELEEQAGVFIDKISGDLEENHRKMRELVQSREENLQRLDSFINSLTNAKRQILED